MTGALTYLAVRSIRNGFVLRLRRLRQPRYLFIALAVIGYFALMIFNRTNVGGWRIPDRYESMATIAVAVGAFLVMALSWLLPGSGSLTFTLAEVNFLFPAPIGRRRLLGYRIVRLLIAACGGALFFTLIGGPTRPLGALLFAAKTALIMSVLAVHEAGISLYRTNQQNTGGLSIQRNLPVLVSIVLLTGLSAFALARFAFADGIVETVVLTTLVAVLLAANVVWVLRSDAAFEEEAAITAEKVGAAVAAVRKGARPARVTAARTTPFRLSASGPVEMAILWKNWLLFGRTPRMLNVTIGLSLLLVVGGYLAAEVNGAGEKVVPILFLVLALFAVTFGPVMAKWDLRQDLANLVVLKTWPVSGAAIFRGELLAPAVALCSSATIAIVLAGVLAPHTWFNGPAAISGRLSLTLAAILVANALIITQLVIQNGIAVSFPAWLRITPGTGIGGIEATGQMMVVMYGGLIAMAVAALVPAAMAAAVMFMLGGTLLPAVAFAAVLLVECYAAVEILGAILDRTDLQDLPVHE